MKTTYATFLFGFCSILIQAQSVILPAPNINAHFGSRGSLFHDLENAYSGFEAPAGSGIYAIFASGLWVGGVDENDTLRLASQQYCGLLEDVNCDYIDGPFSENGSDALTISRRYGGITTVTAHQIEENGLYWDCVEEPGCDPNAIFPNGYVIPPSFYTWPSYSDTTLETAKNLAPFLDFNGDSLYNPDHGDRPQICGDIAAFTIFNDNTHPRGESSGVAIGLEVQAMMYAYYDQGDASDNSIFIKFKLINRGQNTLHDTYVGMWTDINLGGASTNYIGSDVERSMFYGYNPTKDDPSSVFGSGYNNDLGVVGIRVLAGVTADPNGMDGEAIPSEYTTYGNKTTGWGDGIPDNERLGMSSLIYHHYAGMTLPPYTTPVTAPEFYYGLKGLWLVGDTMTVGGFGWNPFNPAATPTKYAYFGRSDPLLWATNGIQPSDSNWTQADSHHNRAFPAIQSSGPFIFPPGAIQYIDYAAIFARDSHNSGEDPLATLRAYADEVVTMTCDNLQDVVSPSESSQNEDKLVIFPNPTTDQATIFLRPAKNGSYSIIDLSGRKVASGIIDGNRTKIDVTGFSKGLYIIIIQTRESQVSKKLIVGS